MINKSLKKFIRGVVTFACLCAVFLFTGSSAWAIETVLQYSLTETHTPSAEQSKKKQKETQLASKKEVVLGDGFFSVKEKSLQRIYDFKKHRIHYLDHQAKTRTEISLFADPAFRINEFQHRMRMDEVVVKAGGLPLEDLFTLESIFGVESESKKVKITEDAPEKGKIKFLSADKIVSEIILNEKYPLPAGGMFNRFLVYDNSLHPLIRKRIIEKQLIPVEIQNSLQSMDGTDRFVLTLNNLKTQPDRGFDIPLNYALSKKKPGAGPAAGTLEKLIQSAKSKTKSLKHDKEWFLNYAREAAKKKNYLDAALSVFEYGLQTGDQQTTSEEIQKLAVHQKDDNEVDRFFRSLGIAGPEQAQRAILELGKLDRKKLKRAHMIDIMIANQQSVLGQNAEAQKRMLGALKSNPYIAGAYKDLGDMFYAGFDMVSAWMCWDFARKQAPEHFMLKPISDYEADLLKNFPDFFS